MPFQAILTRFSCYFWRDIIQNEQPIPTFIISVYVAIAPFKEKNSKNNNLPHFLNRITRQ